MKHNIHLIRIASTLFMLALCSGMSRAETALERRYLQEAAPHTTAAKSNAKVIAHYATINGYLEGLPRNAERLVALRESVDACVKNPNAFALPVQPPTEWPDFLHGYRLNVYTAERYLISYRRDWTYAGPLPNCSLLESSSYTATLQSTAGLCQIDLIQKTASGQCDMAAHRAAKPLQSMLPRSAPQQVVANLRCGNEKIFDTENCIAVDGRLKTSFPLVISRWADHGMHEKAVSAALDMEVSESVFAPHLQSGFTVAAKPH